jgi:hypothetical protein
MDKTVDLLEVAGQTIRPFGEKNLDESQRAAWEALPPGERTKLQEEARKLARDAFVRQARAEVATHGEKAREHYSAMSPAAQDALGLTALLRAPTAAAKPRTRARGAGRPAARRSATHSRAGPSDDEGPSDEPPPAGRLCQLSGCDRELPLERRKYCCDPHGDRARKRTQRKRDRLTPERVPLRAVENGAAGRAKPCVCSPKGHLVIGGVCFHCCHEREEVAA